MLTAYVGRQLENADALRQSHRRVGVSERVRNANAPVRTVQYARLIQRFTEASLKRRDRCAIRVTEQCSSLGTSDLHSDFASALNC